VKKEGATTRLENIIGKEIIKNNQFTVNVGKASNGNLNPSISFKNRAGQVRNVSLLSGEAMIIRDELPPELQERWHEVLTEAHQMNSEYVELAQTKDQLLQFRRAALTKVYGKERAENIVKNGI
jgi:hypothetical protein